jgi:hypothetical protein
MAARAIAFRSFSPIIENPLGTRFLPPFRPSSAAAWFFFATLSNIPFSTCLGTFTFKNGLPYDKRLQYNKLCTDNYGVL